MDDAHGSRLEAQMAFLLKADALKTVTRSNHIADGSRRENSAEHSWHVALMAMVLVEHYPEPVTLRRVLELLIVHDLIEIYAGDTVIYDEEAAKGRIDRESEAARTLFGLLPEGQADSFAALWREFEDRQTPEAKFARAIDALAPTWLQWGEHANPVPGDLTIEQVLRHKSEILRDFPSLSAVLNQVVGSAGTRGLIRRV